MKTNIDYFRLIEKEMSITPIDVFKHGDTVVCVVSDSKKSSWKYNNFKLNRLANITHTTIETVYQPCKLKTFINNYLKPSKIKDVRLDPSKDNNRVWICLNFKDKPKFIEENHIKLWFVERLLKKYYHVKIKVVGNII